jgi:hypothetical protein
MTHNLFSLCFGSTDRPTWFKTQFNWQASLHQTRSKVFHVNTLGHKSLLNNNKSSVHTSQETHYVSTTKTNRLMLFGEIIAVYCENHMEHINTLCEQNAEFLHAKAGGTLKLLLCFKWLIDSLTLCIPSAAGPILWTVTTHACMPHTHTGTAAFIFHQFQFLSLTLCYFTSYLFAYKQNFVYSYKYYKLLTMSKIRATCFRLEADHQATTSVLT